MDDEADPPLLGGDLETDRALPSDGVRGVQQEVQHDLGEPGRRAGRARDVGLEAALEGDLTQVGLRPDEPHRVLDHLDHVARRVDLVDGRFAAREVEQVADDPVDPLGLLAHPREELALLLRLEVAALDELHEAADRAQRVADLVRDPRGEAADRGELLAAHQRLLRGPELGGGALELREATAQRLLLAAELLLHLVERHREPRELGRALDRDVGLLARRDALGRARERAERPHDQAGEQDVGEQQDHRRGEADVEEQEAGQRACGADLGRVEVHDHEALAAATLDDEVADLTDDGEHDVALVHLDADDAAGADELGEVLGVDRLHLEEGAGHASRALHAFAIDRARAEAGGREAQQQDGETEADPEHDHELDADAEPVAARLGRPLERVLHRSVKLAQTASLGTYSSRPLRRACPASESSWAPRWSSRSIVSTDHGSRHDQFCGPTVFGTLIRERSPKRSWIGRIKRWLGLP